VPQAGGSHFGRLGQIPVLVELRQYKTSVLDLIRQFLRRHKLRLESADIETLLDDGQFLLLVDGVNELPNEDAQRDLKTFRQNYPDTPMIFTTRDLGVGGDLGIEKKLEMQPLTEEQMQQFVRAYLPEQGEEMLRRLGGRLREFGQTPLLLWMLCIVFEQVGVIPKNLGSLFREFDKAYEKLKCDIPVSEGFRDWRFKLLRHLGFAMTQGESPRDPQLVISREEAESILGDFLQGKVPYSEKCAVDWLKDLLRLHLIELVIESGKEDRIRFRHQLFQEYYAAEYLLQRLRHLSDEKLKRDYLNYLKWTEPLTLMLALEEKEAQGLRVVKLAVDVDLQLGARLAGEVKPEFQEKTVGLILELDVPELLKIEFLGITRSECAIARLSQTLNHESPDICWSATNGLGKIGTEQAFSGLLKALEDPDVDVYTRAAEWLGYLGCRAALQGLRKKLADINSSIHERQFYSDLDARIWMSIVEAIGKLNKQEAISELHNKVLEGLDVPLNFFVACGAGKLLGQIDAEGAVPELLQALEDPSSHIRRQQAAVVLGEMGNKEAIPGLRKASLEDLEFSVRQSATEALANLDREAAIQRLLKELAEPNDANNRKWAAEILIKMNNQTVVPGLRELLNHPDENVSWSAAIALGQLSRKEALPSLIDRLKYDNCNVRGTAATVLGQLGNQQAIPALREALKDKHYSVRRSAAIALGQLGSEEAIPELLKALRHYHLPDGGMDVEALVKLDSQKVIIRGISNEELEKLGGEEAIKQWRWEYQNLSVRVKVAEALGKIDSKEAIKGLLEALNYLGFRTRWAAAIALGQLRKKEAIPELLEALKHSDDDFRQKVVEALVKLGNEEAIQELMKGLDAQDNSVRRIAAEALGKIGSPTTLYDLWQMRKTGREDLAYTIEAIQKRCQFYNLEVFNSPSVEEETKTGSEISKSSTYIFHQPVGNLNTGDVNIHGDQIGIERNQLNNKD
jgi:HEAT repeat protein